MEEAKHTGNKALYRDKTPTGRGKTALKFHKESTRFKTAAKDNETPAAGVWRHKGGDVMSGKYVTEKERYQIEILLKDGKSRTEIAKLLGRNKSTIGREIERGMVTLRDGKTWEDYKVYKADVAQRKYEGNRKNKTPDLKIGNDMEFVRFVEYWIGEMKYSPQAVLYKIKQEGLQFRTDISKQTLYRYIYGGVFLHLTEKELPSGRRKKKKQEGKKEVALNNLKGKSISERPKEAESRKTYGHWEMDTVQPGKEKGSACLLVLSERKYREEIITKMPDKKSASVITVLNRIERRMGAKAFREKFKSITCDNGVEFLDFQGIEKSCRNRKKKRTEVYFCHPYSAWERGTNENINRQIRRWVPKGKGIGGIPDKEILFIQDWINNYPRGIFGGASSDKKRVSDRII